MNRENEMQDALLEIEYIAQAVRDSQRETGDEIVLRDSHGDLISLVDWLEDILSGMDV